MRDLKGIARALGSIVMLVMLVMLVMATSACGPIAPSPDGGASTSTGHDASSDGVTSSSTGREPTSICGDGIVDGGAGETCDDGNQIDGDGCSATCTDECANPGGGSLMAENGTGMTTNYCYEPGDSIDTRARKACESHFGVGACCIIVGGYSDLQWGQCGHSGDDEGTFHFHPDSHPEGHCDPFYVVGDVISPGWCGAIRGNFLD